MKILVVEDDELVAHALTTVLTNHNYAVEVAVDGLAAWDLVQAFDYDLIVLDVVIPKLDGISLCRQIRSKGLSTPILLLTGRDSSHDKAIGLDAGADDYLIKPFDEEELVARIRALLRRSGLVSPPVLKWGDLQLDPSSCEATYRQKHLSLTPKEYALLELFLRNSRRVFSCGTILEHLWSYEDLPSEEAVRTHIKGLRQKLKAAGANSDLLETVYGIGYRLKPLEKRAEGAEEAEGAEGQRSRGARQVTPHSEFRIPNSEFRILPTHHSTLSAVAGIWHKFKPRIAEQIGVLEQASAAVSANNALSPELLESARKEAHTLAGSLGTFGLAQESKLAKEIEQMLKGDRALLLSEATNFCRLVLALRQEIEQKEEAGKPQADSEQPLLLIVNRERSIAQQLTAAATDRGFRVAIANNLDTARNKLYQEHPSIVLLDPDICPRHEESLSLLAELKQRQPPVPVLVLTEQTDLSHRLQIARSGGCTFLQKPMPATQVLDAVAQALENAPHAEAHLLVVDDDPKILAVLPALLNPWGLKVTTLEDPRRFWETLEATAPDLLILDVEMPYVNGIDLCQVVRNEPRWSDLPILFLTVHHDADIVDRVFSAGADDFVRKPIVGSELVTRIVNRLERMKLLHRINQVRATNNVESENRCKLNEQLQSELNERQRTQAALQNSQALFAGIIAIADDAIISIDSNQRITLFNSGAERIFGYSAAEAIGQPLDLLLPKRFAAAHRQHVDEFGQSPNLARRMGERREIYGCRKDGTEFPAEASISKLNLGGETVYTVYLHDVSDRKQIERMKDEFISVVSHELRTPLTSIHGSLGMLASGLLQPDSPQGQRLLQIATDSTERLVRLINDILDIERIESGKVKMEKESCDVTELITEAVNVMQPLADKAGITLSVSSLPIQVWADPDRIVQTLTNLLSNAIKFSPSGSTVWLSVELGSREKRAGSRGKRAEGAGGAEGAILATSHQSLVTDNCQLLTSNQQPATHITFQVQDTGRGIPADKLDSIFERFQQVDSTDSRKHDGTGLGLAICRSIVQQHDGHIWVESVLGEGSTFYFTLPILQAKSSREADNSLTPPSILTPDSSPLILICDDDPHVGTELQTLLEHKGYRTVVVHSGQEAIASTATLHPDAILLDLLMPKMNGWEVMAKLKERSDTKDIPIVICSICAPSQSPLSQNSSAWVSKPVDENSLFDSLKLALAKNARPVRVLLVEDDAELAELLLALLKSHNIETFLAKNGREAIRLSQEIKPDLLILDLILPQVDGFGVVEWLHQHDRLYSIPLVVYSAKDLDQSERNRLKLGHTEFLTKGRVSPQEFEQRVLELIGQMTQSKPHDASNDK
ncbi:two-component system response regulator CreB [Chroococcidiopsis sp. CCALA 051]|uniref:response regulator n=1 Tax=Chroococcidiopsis sp. CCALA 051 TaxID=869949 RepID=UPI000D0CD582|nr:response regulator [Chroococcidiopsis sp. CCALA 051]PSM50508.1 two-component system response regulator CreB [Chroococcidiopsis sp. CCALA 051]